MFLTVIYNLFIMPLEMIFELVFSLAYRIFSNPGAAILALSLVMNFMVLPLYRRADAMQEEERDKTVSMEKWVKHIKAAFTGDERYMMLNEYYRTQNYKPIYALRSSLSLLLQIPFFIAAYHFLSNLELLKGMECLFLSDLGSPDGLIQIGSLSINLMPIIMTLINVVSAYIYLRGFPLKDKIQTYGIAAIFLVLLYNSPSGLVLYWTLNQVFSALKNVFMKLVKSRRVLNIFFSVMGIILGLVTVFCGNKSALAISAAAVVFVLCQIPMMVSFIKYIKLSNGLIKSIIICRHSGKSGQQSVNRKSVLNFAKSLELQETAICKCEDSNKTDVSADCLENKTAKIKKSGTVKDGIHGLVKKKRTKEKVFSPMNTRTYILGQVYLTIVIGLIIPLSVISSSPEEFVTSVSTPGSILINTVSITAGFALVWISVFYYLASAKGRKVITVLMLIFGIGATVNFLFFGRNLGTLSNQLVFESSIFFSCTEIIINGLTVLAVIAAVFLLVKFGKKYIMYVYMALIIGSAVMAIMNSVNVGDVIKTAAVKEEDANTDGDLDEKIIHLSKSGKNVIIIMLDRAISGYVPFMFEEKSELVSAFDGFTYYPNTVSFGQHTNFAAPAVFGGYEYTPTAMNERDTESLESKHNEALLMLPVLFSENGYDVTVCDPPYAGYREIPDLSIYDGYEGISAYNLNGKYLKGNEYYQKLNDSKGQIKNFFSYSIMKSLPVIAQVTVYNDGNYFGASNNVPNMEAFLESYSTLCELTNITEIEESEEKNLLVFENDSTHSPVFLNPVTYEPGTALEANISIPQSARTINGVTMKLANAEQVKHYEINMSSFLKIGEWFDYLREQGVYDNTRIILVSDHGFGLYQFDNMWMSEGRDVQFMNPVLMVKDFDSTGELVIDNTFMTNADVPALAVEGLFEEAVNPFTGVVISNDAKSEGDMMTTTSDQFYVQKNNGNTFNTEDGQWWGVHDNIFVEENWRMYE